MKLSSDSDKGLVFSKPNKRRVFYRSDKDSCYKIFSFDQHRDGSIYVSWPYLEKTKWISANINNDSIVIEASDNPKHSQKLSLHGSGVVKFKQDELNADSQRVKGNQLINFKQKQIAPRHLFTALVSKPQDLVEHSPFGNRTSDVVTDFQHMDSFVIMFFAIPRQTFVVNVEFRPSFHLDYFEENFQKYIGFGRFSLAYHDILWFAYCTRNMGAWPKYTHVFYTDGFYIPVFIGENVNHETKLAQMKFALQQPTYKIEGNSLILSFDFSEKKD